MALYTPYNSKASGSSGHATKTEFDILKSSHKFLRDEEEIDESQLSWDEKLAKKYYSTLYREYAVCDLKHYKSGNFALRWRTEEEVLSGAGETTCGNTRCPLHREFPDAADDVRPALTTLELPFSYKEDGESKFALVKVVLCSKCCKKLMWKRNKEKEERRQGQADESRETNLGARSDRAQPELQGSGRPPSVSPDRRGEKSRYARRGRSSDSVGGGDGQGRRRSSRSRSPRRRKDNRYDHSP
ncbi:folate-sensitive fragile site protein Fra10Ac1-domain-containing protein [Earliella scabrosa]|nr:folate-sensitive fragile site protein Fra10Ac1-domain-containing protein [Earliella scabrosa]